jgi:pilus assembly protein CpaB
MSVAEKLRSGAKSWGLLGGAIILGMLAFFASTWYLQRRSSAIENEWFAMQGEKRSVVVASVPLTPGAILGADNMAAAEVPVINLSEQAVGVDYFGDYEGKVLITPMSAGEPLLSHFVAGTSAERFSDLLREGERAVTIPVDEIISNDGMLMHGDRVDLMLLIKKESQGTGQQEPDSLAPLLQNVRVLSVGKRALVTRDADFSGEMQDPSSDGSYTNLTIGVTADNAARLLLARNLGSITVMLRNRGDQKPFESQLLSRDGLLTGNPDAGTFEFFSGSQVSDGKLKLTVQTVDGKMPMPGASATPQAPESQDELAPVAPTQAVPAVEKPTAPDGTPRETGKP